MLVLMESENRVSAPLDYAALIAASRAFTEIAGRLVEAFRPVIWQLKIVYELLFGRTPPAVMSHDVTLLAGLAGMWSHTVWVCPTFECNSRMTHDVDGHVLICAGGHRYDVERLQLMLGLPLP